MLLMAGAGVFAGFSPELPRFLGTLRDNNSRESFAAHRAEYDKYLLAPARSFVIAIGELLQSRLGQDIHAEPKVFGSILPINRDTRFSPDKTPYKTHLDLWFWEGGVAGQSRHRPGYFFRLTPESLILGAGMHAFSADSGDDQLETYRRGVLDQTVGPRLDEIARTLGLEIQGRTYKRVPAGLPSEHPRADWLRHTGLFAQVEQSIPTELYTPALPKFCLATYMRLAPLQQWLVQLLPA
jgi:uncharacterized protein (TIGR02453 family)